MATTKVSALTETTSPQANDELLINQSGVSKKVKITNLPAGLDTTKLPLAGGQMTGNITMAGSQTVDGRDVSADGTQLDTNTSAIATKAPINSPTFTGTVAIPNIANLETAVAANTAKVTNATHTGDVTGATTLTIANDAVTVDKLNLISTGSVPSLEAKGTSGVTDGYIQLNCAENSHGIKLKSPPHSAGASYTLTFPNDDGNANQKLTTNGSGVLTWTDDNATDATKLPLAGGAMTGPITTNSTFDGRDVSADGTKLDGIEASADVTDATNVTAAGALMDSEVTNLAQVKAFDSSDYATAAQGTTADAALPKAGGTMTGNLLVESSASANTIVRSKGTAADGYRHGFEAVNGHTGGETWSMFSTNNSDGNYGGGKFVIAKAAMGSASVGSLIINSAGKVSINNSATTGTDTDTSNTGSVTLDFDANQNFVLTLTGNVTLANPSTETVGQSGFITFIQDGTGSRTVSLGTDYETAGGAGLTLTSTASATDIVPYVVVASGRILLGTPQLAFS